KIKIEKDPEINEVFTKLLEIANDSGEDSVLRKEEKTSDLLKHLDPLSARFVTRIPIGKLRQGFSEKTVIDALANHNKLIQKEIEENYNIRPDIGYLAKLIKEKKLEDVSPEIGVPVVPILCQRLNSTTEMIKKMGTVAVEPKFDGLRIFIHFRRKDNFLRIFTRNMNFLDSNIFPELKNFGRFVKANEIILDTEAVGIDSKREMFLDFQKTIQRRRKHDVEKTSGEVPLQFQVFDCLLVDGESLIKMPYIERRKKIESVVINGDLLKIDESTITNDPEVIKKLHFKYLKMGLEGVVVKRANGQYVSGRTGWNWVKMKEEEGMEGRLSDTIDCIVMGYFVGKGKRSQFGLGKILVGIKDGDKIRTLTKVGTGLTEKMLVEVKKRLEKLKSKEKPKEYEAQKDLIPDVWATPSLVVEVSADSISVSSKHSLGLSLRFPRFLKIREDKGINEATTLEELKEILKLQ
ncbi:MAG: ATP-dependent DNA ligase, partial [Candidatus Woesebacteria bacterium]|nr:ATP-dependent DNA ligase [Candidatus Woesebacteria bacterium]